MQLEILRAIASAIVEETPEWLQLIYKVQYILGDLEESLPTKKYSSNETNLSIIRGMLLSFGGYQEQESRDREEYDDDDCCEQTT